MSENAGSIHGSLVYSTDLFNADTIAAWATHFQVLLHSIADQPNTSIDELEIYTSEEKKQQVADAEERRSTQRTKLRAARGARQEFPGPTH